MGPDIKADRIKLDFYEEKARAVRDIMSAQERLANPSAEIDKGISDEAGATQSIRAQSNQNLANKLTKNLSLFKALIALKQLNTYDICNPLNFSANKLFPLDSIVGGKLQQVAGVIKEIQAALRGFSIIPGTIEVEAISENGQEIINAVVKYIVDFIEEFKKIHFDPIM